MGQKQHTVDQIIANLRRADVLLGKGTNVLELRKQLEITEQTCYRRRQKYGGTQPKMAKELKALQKKNARVKKMVAEQGLDMRPSRKLRRETGKPRTSTANARRGAPPFGATESIGTSSVPSA